MTQGLTRALNLLPLEEALKQAGIDAPSADPTQDLDDLPSEEALAAMELALNKSSEINKGMDLSGQDHAAAMDKIHAETLKHSQDLMDLGFNVDVRSARGIFEVATMMYKNAIDSKNLKRDAQLKAMRLALEERKLALQEKKAGGDDDKVIEGEGFIIADRNDLLKQMLASKQKK